MEYAKLTISERVQHLAATKLKLESTCYQLEEGLRKAKQDLALTDQALGALQGLAVDSVVATGGTNANQQY